MEWKLRGILIMNMVSIMMLVPVPGTHTFYCHFLCVFCFDFCYFFIFSRNKNGKYYHIFGSFEFGILLLSLRVTQYVSRCCCVIFNRIIQPHTAISVRLIPLGVFCLVRTPHDNALCKQSLHNAGCQTPYIDISLIIFNLLSPKAHWFGQPQRVGVCGFACVRHRIPRIYIYIILTIGCRTCLLCINMHYWLINGIQYALWWLLLQSKWQASA